MIDLHTHTTRCCHATGLPREYAEFAIRNGITHFGQSCHSPWMMQQASRQMAMRANELDDYVKDVLDLKAEFEGQLNVLLGLEIDWFKAADSKIKETAQRHPYDYFIGSVHHLPQFDFEYPSVRQLFRILDDEKEIWCEYFLSVAAMIESGLVDIVAHFDLPKVRSTLDPSEWIPLAQPAIEAAKGTEIVFEINTSGRDKKVGEYFPHPKLLDQIHQAGIAVTFGSDAHAPWLVGRYQEEAIKLLREIGFKSWCWFEGRERREMPLPPQ
jgi:histidinol-phosphatase (PHP family)